MAVQGSNLMFKCSLFQLQVFETDLVQLRIELSDYILESEE